MISPVFQALVNARLSQVSKSEAQIAEQVNATLGPRPPDTHRPARFIRWCEDQSLPWRPATPAVIAAFVLQHTKVGNLVEELRTLSLAHTSQNLPDPCSAYQVTEALSRLVKGGFPRSWPKSEQAIFLTLPIELQKYLLPREEHRDQMIRRLQTDNAELRKQLAKQEEKTNGTIENQPAENPDAGGKDIAAPQ